MHLKRYFARIRLIIKSSEIERIREQPTGEFKPVKKYGSKVVKEMRMKKAK